MLKSYWIVAWRNLLRNRIFSVINITGLAIGLAVSFLIYQYVNVELSYDQFHKNADRIYRVPISYEGSFSSQPPSATNHPAVGPALKADFPEVEDFARLVGASLFINAATVAYEKDASAPVIFNEERIYLADQSFLTIFSFPMIAGTAENALKEPKTAVITESMAKKYFGDEPALGKVLDLNRLDFKVTGVLRDLPENSHLQFDMLLSFSTLGTDFSSNWLWPEFYNYILLTPDADPAALEEKFPAFMTKYLGKIWEEHKFTSSIFLQPLTDIHLKSDLAFEQHINGSKRTVYFLSILAFFVLAIAWINYVNLSTARSLDRSKEVGLRKVSGATRRQLIAQFFFDALLVNVFAVAIAIGLLVLGIPFFENVTGKNISDVLETTGAWYSLSFWSIALGTLALGILVVGLYPAMLLSSFNPAIVLKGKFQKSQSGILLRKGLVAFQYILSIFLIAGTITMYRQARYMQEKDLGYTREQVLVLRSAAIADSTYSRQIQFFRNELQQLPGVVMMSNSGEIPGHAIADRNSIRVASGSEKDNMVTYIASIDEEFLETFEMKLLAGRSFNTNDRFIMNNRDQKLVEDDGYLVGGGQNRILINEDLADKLGFEEPEDAINQIVKFRLGPEYAAEVIGVVKNHHQLSLKEKYEPILYYYPIFEHWKYFSIRLNTPDLEHAIANAQSIYQRAFPSNAFEYFFLDDHFNKQYKSDIQFRTIFGIFTILAIFIACLGLFGLGIFTVTQRTKEIGIRKVLGSSVSAILILFSKDSMRLVLISYFLALPFIYFTIDSWLNSFAFHIPMEWQMYLLPPLFLLAISVATIIFICLRAALRSPTISLRHE